MGSTASLRGSNQALLCLASCPAEGLLVSRLPTACADACSKPSLAPGFQERCPDSPRMRTTLGRQPRGPSIFTSARSALRKSNAASGACSAAITPFRLARLPPAPNRDLALGNLEVGFLRSQSHFQTSSISATAHLWSPNTRSQRSFRTDFAWSTDFAAASIHAKPWLCACSHGDQQHHRNICFILHTLRSDTTRTEKHLFVNRSRIVRNWTKETITES